MSGRADLGEIVRALGDDLLGGGRRALVPGPGHSAADRSVSLLLDGSRVVAYSFAGDDWREVLDDLRRRNPIYQDGRLLRAGVPVTWAPSPSGAARRRCAQALWAEGLPAAGRLAERHVRSRGVGRGLGDALRHHPAVSSAVYLGRGLRRPALLACLRDLAGEVRAVEVTYLAADRRSGADGLAAQDRGRAAAGRRGAARSGGGASAGGGGGVLGLVGVGALRPAGLGAALHLQPQGLDAAAGVTAVTIAADRGADGERSARVLAARLRALGVSVVVAWPPVGFGDWNEAEAAERRREAGRGGGEPDGGAVPADGAETLR